MVQVSRRALLGLLGAGTVAGGGAYWVHQSGPDCPESLTPTAEFRRSSFDVWSRAVVDEDLLFVGSGTGITYMTSGTDEFRLLALSRNGEPEWVIKRTLGGGMGKPLPIGDRVIASTGGNELLALDREYGRSVWEVDLGNHESGHMSSLMVGFEDMVIGVVNQPGHEAFESPYAVAGFAIDDGAVEWVSALPGEVRRGFALVDGTVIAVTDDGQVSGIDATSGEHRWEAEVDGSTSRISEPVRFAGGVWIPRDDGTLFGFDPTSGEDLGRIALDETDEEATERDEAVIQALHADEETLFIGDVAGRVHAFDTAQNEQWTYSTPAWIAGMDRTGDRLAVLDQRGVYTELDAESGTFQRKFLLVEGWNEDRCGYQPERRNFSALTAEAGVVAASGYMTNMRLFRPSISRA